MTAEELQEIIKDHALWLENKGGKRADLRGADLQEADLRGAGLRLTDLRGADLRLTDLRGADLRWAVLRGADLRWANLQGANLQGANLQRANLQGANLQGANLRWANLQGAYLQGADLQGAKADEMTSGFWPVCPEKGCFTAFKKLADDAIAKLFIPEHAKRSSATTRKCRCSEALVVEIKDRNGNDVDEGFSKQEDVRGCKLLYKVGETVYPDGFDEDRWNECSNGIHFFMTRREAELY